MGFTNPLQYVAHTSTRAIQEGFGASAKRLGSAALRNPGAAGALMGGTYGAFSDNTSILGGALAGGAIAGGAGFGWRNRGGIGSVLNTVKSKQLGTSFGDVKNSFFAGNRNLSVRNALKSGNFTAAQGGRFTKL